MELPPFPSGLKPTRRTLLCVCACFHESPLSVCAKLELITPAEETTGYSLTGSSTDVKRNALSSFSELKIASACFSYHKFRKRGDSLFFPLCNILSPLKSSCHEEQAVCSRLLCILLDPNLTGPEVSPKQKLHSLAQSPASKKNFH